jgi:hypothetical protein
MMLVDRMRRMVARAIGSYVQRYFSTLRRELHDAKMLAAKSLVWQLRSRGVLDQLADAEFKVFSQFGDDGIIQYLIQQACVRSTTFVEFGVENYAEANTRFLLLNDNWTGLILDADVSNMEAVKRDEVYWRHALTAVPAFISKDNINQLLADKGFTGEIGLLSIDIDGNDYWVWEAITVVQPAIVVIEYNSVFGPHRAVSISYDERFQRYVAHHSGLYWGCSLKAACLLAKRKGYAFVGCNGNGNNAYFVRNDCLGALRPLSVDEGYVSSRFRDSRDQDGRLTYVSGSARLRAIADMPVVDVETGARTEIASLL